MKIRVALFASGAGTNALKLLETAQELKNTEIPLVIVDRPDSSLPEAVRKAYPQVKVKVIPYSGSKAQHEEMILAQLKEFRIDWIFLAGYMRILGPTLINAFRKAHSHACIVNMHPSLLPRHAGKDAYAQAFQAGDSQSGITLHLVDEGVDTGPILLQEVFPREKDDTLSTFTERGKVLEWKLYPQLLRQLDQEGTLMPSLQPSHQALALIQTKNENQLLLFWIRYSGQVLSKEELASLAPRISDSVDQTLFINPDATVFAKLFRDAHATSLQVVHFRPGVTDNPAHAFHELLAFSPLFQNRRFHVHSGEALLRTNQDALPSNPLIHISKEFDEKSAAQLVSLSFPEPSPLPLDVKRFAIRGKSREALAELSKQQFWALSDEEMFVIQAHYEKQNREPTDVEMEILAQTWSEHCKHKIFAANIDYEDEHEKFSVPGLFKSYIAKPTFDLREKKKWAISVFKDNAGIVRFHDNVDLCIKVETHNSPSALDPYGGALTGILGVNRDIMGTGLGARPIANTNVLLFGNPKETHELPKGLLHPSTIFKGVHKGIQDGGNKSGIPTVNGAVLFDESFSGKPLVYCGTVGVLPREVNGIPSASKNQKPGDLIVMVGGAVGADGLHGATSSSLALDQTTPSSMVQIGDPLTQKRVLDFLMEARDAGLYTSLTDNGAGGLSSSIGEMAEATNGARVYLDQVPLKYPGLLPWQIFVSESQERMTLSVSPSRIENLKQLAASRGVQATVVGEFTDSGELEIFYGNERVGHLSLEFLHHGLPKMHLTAKWAGPQPRTSWKEQRTPRKPLATAGEMLTTLLSDPSIASKEKWIRQYDHEVQAATVVKPFEGGEHSAPNDAGLIWMGAHGNDGFSGAAVGSGLCPDFSLIDGGLMAKLAADEAVRNVIVLGCDPEKIALVDNFCWPDPLPGAKNPDAEHKLAQLVRACRELAELVRAYEMPLVSGKDSMKNDFIGSFADGRTTKISVLPTLLVTALGYHPDVRKAVKAHAEPGSVLYVLSSLPAAGEYFGAALAKHYEIESSTFLPGWDLDHTRALYQTYYEATQADLIQSAHDLSEGGLLVALFETLLLNQGGIELKDHSTAELFGEEPGRLLVSVKAANAHAFETRFSKFGCRKLGVVDANPRISLSHEGKSETLSLSRLESAFRGAL